MKRFITIAIALIIGASAGFVLAAQPWRKTSTVPTRTQSSPSTTAGSTTNSENRCQAKNLTLKLVAAQGGNAAGSSYQDAIITNSGSAACDLAPQPSVSLTDDDGNQVGKVAESAAQDAATVSLPAKDSAYLLVKFVANNFPTGTCAAGVTTFKLTLAGSADYLSVPTTQTDWCPGFSVSDYTLSPQ